MRKSAGVFGVVGLLALILPVRADEDAKVRAIIARASKVHGGIDALKKWPASVSKTKGKYHGLGETIDYTGASSLQLPNRLRAEVQSKIGDREFKFVQIINGDKGWTKIGDKTEEMNKDRLDEAKEQMNAAIITHLAALNDKDYQLSPLGEVKVGDRSAVGVRVERKGYRDVNLFFDKDKSLLLKMETRGKDLLRDGAEFTAATLYGDYKKVEGMMIAHKITIEHDGKLFVEGEITEMKLSEKLEDGVFEKP